MTTAAEPTRNSSARADATTAKMGITTMKTRMVRLRYLSQGASDHRLKQQADNEKNCRDDPFRSRRVGVGGRPGAAPGRSLFPLRVMPRPFAARLLVRHRERVPALRTADRMPGFDVRRAE